MEETWEFAALVMASSLLIPTKVASAICMVLIIGCGYEADVKLPSAVDSVDVDGQRPDLAQARVDQNHKSILIHAEPYLNTKYEPHFATLSIYCSPNSQFLPDVWMGVDVTDGPTRREFRPEGFPVVSGEILGGHFGSFFQRGDVYFDDVLTDFPSIYDEVVKDVNRKNGTTERRIERILIGPNRAINDVFLPNVKTAQSMRLEYKRGIGPTFDLTGLKDKIETLEATCAPKDSNK